MLLALKRQKFTIFDQKQGQNLFIANVLNQLIFEIIVHMNNNFRL